MSRSRDRRLLEQSHRALGNLAEWLRDLDTVSIDGEALDMIGMVIHAVDEAEQDLEANMGEGQ